MSQALVEQGIPQGFSVGLELPPVASILMQSLRSVGYSPATAIADLIDNSIAAKAAAVRIVSEKMPARFLAIVDDGNGMDEARLIAAMRFGSMDPRTQRNS